MPAERSYKAHAIVLRARNLGEADKIFTLFSREYGKLDAIAKGVRRPKSHTVGKLELGVEVFLTLHRGRTLDVIISADILQSRWDAITQPAAFATAHLMIELIDAFCEPELALPEVYALLDGALRALGALPEPRALIPRFELRLLGALGVAPHIDDCVRCGAALEALPAWAHLDAGGLSCEACRPHGAEALALSAGDVRNLRALAAGRTRGSGAALVAFPAAARVVDAFLTYHLGKRPKSSRLVEEFGVQALTASLR
ncbi:MAG TPA: DNA repair protein RecO [Candidatus Acidoferrales bacterium]|nr:DNA repair protein RecO [Candidatus Acidoferrales bacterium]